MARDHAETLADGRRALRRFLSGPQGRRALTWLRSFTVEASRSWETPVDQVRFMDGQAALVQQLDALSREKDDGGPGDDAG